jgi:phosphoserine phosphatase
MAALPSIGTIVSFFYQISSTSSASGRPLELLHTGQRYVLSQQQGNSLVLNSPLQYSLPESEAFTVAQTETEAVIRLFGEAVDWTAVVAVLQLSMAGKAVPCRIYRPHPALAGAIELGTCRLTVAQQQQLAALAVERDIEAVYLSGQPLLAKPGLLVMDMDSTAIQIECIDEIAKLAGVGEQVAAVTLRAMQGELDFAQSLTERVAALQDAPAHILQQVLDTLPLMPGLTELVTQLKQHGWQVAIASGGFTFFTDALRQQLGLTATFANVLEIIDSRLTGHVVGDIVDANSKANVVRQLAADYGIEGTQTVAIGDGANDIPMLHAAALGVAFHAKPKVQAQAKAAIRHGSLLQLLYLLD